MLTLEKRFGKRRKSSVGKNVRLWETEEAWEARANTSVTRASKAEMGRLGEAETAAAAPALSAAMDLTTAQPALLVLLGDGEVGTRPLERDGPTHDEGSRRDMMGISGFRSGN